MKTEMTKDRPLQNTNIPFLMRKSPGVSYWLLGLILITLSGLLLLWLMRSQREQASEHYSVATATTSSPHENGIESSVGTMQVERRDFESQFTAVGIIEIAEPLEQTISARARGRIEKLYIASSGGAVTKGQPLYQFYSPDILNAESEYLIALHTRESQSKAIGTERSSIDDMHSDGGLVEASKSRLELYGMTNQQIHNLETTGAKSNTITITSPTDGIVLQRFTQVGSYVDEGAPLFQIADLSTVWAELDIPEAEIQFIYSGQSIRIQTDTYSDESFEGKVILISPIEDQTSKTIRVRVALNNAAHKLRPQMTFTATIPVKSGSALSVPVSAVIRNGNGDYVWVKDSSGSFVSHKVRLGARSPDDYYAVLDGLTEGEAIAATGAYMLDAERQLSENNPMATMNMSGGDQGSKTSGVGSAIVRSIDPAKGTITLDHGNIPGVMPAMTMGYKVESPDLLKAVRANDNVRFTLTKNQNGEYHITAITKQQ